MPSSGREANWIEVVVGKRGHNPRHVDDYRVLGNEAASPSADLVR